MGGPFPIFFLSPSQLTSTNLGYEDRKEHLFQGELGDELRSKGKYLQGGELEWAPPKARLVRRIPSEQPNNRKQGSSPLEPQKTGRAKPRWPKSPPRPPQWVPAPKRCSGRGKTEFTHSQPAPCREPGAAVHSSAWPAPVRNAEQMVFSLCFYTSLERKVPVPLPNLGTKIIMVIAFYWPSG